MIEPTFSIRSAELDDMNVLLRFIRDLAELQGILDRLIADEKYLSTLLFESNSASEAIVLEYQNEVVGFAIFSTMNINRLYQDTPALYIDELYIAPDFRSKGFGKAFFMYIANIAKQRKLNRVEWWVVEGNDKAADFYRRLGAVAFPEYNVWRLKQEQFAHVN
tara:strand:- start:23557 stop:24045 length:489 start_codon:yes stop_codon:yes gene_type:complete